MDKESLKEQYEELQVQYRNAIRIAQAFIDNVKDELAASPTIRNPIKDDYWRLKTFDSALAKCRNKGIEEPDIEQMKQIVGDIAGIRIICLYLDDVERVAKFLKNAPGISITKIKDYIVKPKESGYSSLHLKTLVQVPTQTEGTRMIPVEIQIRTEMMETWAQAEHRAKYKSAKGPTEEVNKSLLELAENFRKADELLVKIRKSSEDD